MNRICIIIFCFSICRVSLAQYDEVFFLGEWDYSSPNSCIETYNFGKNGLLKIESKFEIVERSYVFEKIDADTFYVTFETNSTNGLESCAGEGGSSEVGNEFSMILSFNKTHDQFFMYLRGYEHYILGPFVER